MLHDYHVHLESGPYTAQWIRQYYDTAMERGLSELGFSEHAYRFSQASSLLETSWADAAFHYDVHEYVHAVEQARQQGMAVKTGIEMDYIPSREAGIRAFLESVHWDYIIGSVHWIGDWGFDLPRFAHEWKERDVVDVYYSYYEILQMAIRSQLFDIIGHFDLIKVFGYRPPRNVIMTAVYESTIRLMKDYDMVLEINTAGLYKPAGQIYPAPEILQMAGKYRLPVIITSDAHCPEHVGRDFPLAQRMAREADITTLVRFEKRKRQYVPLLA
ncbi:histidinol phosphate phosphatase HisJ family [Desulfurispirillum indicum S5]|uniref:Histidinol-phosphatase n=1 Tax=Desulfurispirillum indicum (strain ATCC BAA-1389 / DSM 22839 / S5) TaxID=653733 RepID=E6W5E1_DESIS|nr:histidinol-phosphatase [Desulfurispirillum indicum]ADU64872.1 histidinol phosphate phosphatase HisJ family [Desulfurispirillum indicum S5]